MRLTRGLRQCLLLVASLAFAASGPAAGADDEDAIEGAADSGEEPLLTFKEHAERAYGVILEVGEGSGSRGDPIKVLSTTPTTAAATELLVLRTLGRDRGILWRVMETNHVPEIGPHVIQRRITTIELTSDQVVRQVESFYFERLPSALDPDALSDPVIAHSSDSLGVDFPYEIGFLHYQDVKNYGALGRPDLGYGLEYYAPAINVTIYIIRCRHRMPPHLTR